MYINFILTCLTIIEFANLVVKVIKLRNQMIPELCSIPEDEPELDDEIRKRLYS